MNIKKIGLTALAASMVSVSAHAGALSLSGGASVNIGGYSGDNQNNATSFTMANQITASGSGELDNGMNVSVSFELDNGETVFDNHSVTVSSEGLGTLKFSGHGGSSATSSIDGTVAGDIWDGFDGAAAVAVGITGQAVSASGGINNSMFYTLPEIMDGVSLFASYNPQVSGTSESELGYGITYTGIEGLSFSYAIMDENTGVTGTSGEQTAWKATYAYGPVTVGMSNNDYDVGATGTDQETDSYSIAYTVSDEMSISYGTEEIDDGNTSTDAEYSAIVASYTAGGMTLTTKLEEAENTNGTTNSSADFEYWTVSAAFAF